ncbi:autotransporter outer membrane beta-barrel domain-containing protein [Agrobacterium sp. V1]|uniref:autotransporter outer membrane beta-barrel domain-containing protein n=1 Tax=Agrobacterium sp. V1 TaxID=3061957 RepID=UPI002671DF7A|nr:autotransporter outer membrane beta-barrel domain-containing protein [Agrobacterium sp. V1]MDO3445256.1 autotransporter outer membrane beta-barrel domain-containing protein [Agrobacterium sp. V1]
MRNRSTIGGFRSRLFSSVSLRGGVLGFVFLNAPVFLTISLSGFSGSAWASCVLAENLYTCSGASVTAGNVNLTSSTAIPNISAILDPTYLRTNTNTVAPNGFGLQVRATAGHGDIYLTQDAGSSVTGGVTGLSVQNDGSGKIDMKLSGNVSSQNGAAAAIQGSSGDVIFAQLGGVIDGSTGATVRSATSGSINVDVNGQIIGRRANGLFVASAGRSDDLTVMFSPESSVSSVAPGATVARVDHRGTGQMLINADGAVLAGSAQIIGLDLSNYNSSETFVYNQASTGRIDATSHGILSTNRGRGATELRIGGVVKSADGYGVFARNETNSTDFSIAISGDVNSSLAGVVGQQRGSGATDVVVSGDITSATSVGLQVEHAGQKDVSVKQTAGTITGHVVGINIRNNGSADASISLSSNVIGGVQVHGRGDGNISFTQDAGSINSTLAAGSVAIDNAGGTLDFTNGVGLHIVNYSRGSSSIELAGDVTAPHVAVAADNTHASSSLSIVQKSGVIAAKETAINLGVAGDIVLDINGTVRGGDGHAIYMLAPIKASVDIRENANVTATSGTAIFNADFVTPDGALIGGDLVVRSAGTVTGDSLLRAGNDRFELLGGRYTGNIYGDYGDIRDTTARADTDIPGGNDTFIWSGGTLLGGFFGGQGSDRAEISAPAYNGTQTLDGGDDTSIEDDMIDTLTFRGINATSMGDKIMNWEDVRLDASNFSISDGAWAVGMVGQPETGIALANNSTLNGMSGLHLTSNLMIDNTSSFIGQGGGQGRFTVSGNVNSAGTVTTQDGAAGDIIEIAGNYVGDSGRVALDTMLGDDSSSTDRLKISGDTNGNTLVSIRNAGGSGAQTKDGIRIIEVQGKSAKDAFELDGGFQFNGRSAVVGGAYAYQLYQGSVDGSSMQDWYLRSERKDPFATVSNLEPEHRFQPGVPVYEAYSNVLLGMNGLQTLHQRIGGSDESLPPKTDSGPGLWTRIEGSHTRMAPSWSSTGVSYRQDHEKIQVGIAGMALDTEDGQLIASAAVHYIHGDATTKSLHDSDLGGGQILTNGYGFSGSVTWYDERGFYIDMQGQTTWYRSDLSYGGGGGILKSDVETFGHAVSIEAGHQIPLNSAWTLVPQTQFTYSSVRSNDFTDVFGSQVRLGQGESVEGRLGLGISHDRAWQDAEGRTHRFRLNGTTDLHYAFSDHIGASVAGVSAAQHNDRLFVGFTPSASYSWNDDKYFMYGGATIKGSVDNFANSHDIRGHVGFRLTW